ncbi:hypothetical protein Tco_0652623 [Tanacetum coccineum]|uniref:Aminotransferase-like plant mobile domain-containing protein n=1 Tax=Tanacetum coccineum TaxID=301880 RepID=A0ABQ4WY65_9ASTR
MADDELSPSGEFSGRHGDYSFHLPARWPYSVEKTIVRSCRDCKPITAGMLLQNINSEEFDTMNDHDVVCLCLLGVLELVLLGHEIRYTVPDWCFRLVANIKACDMYPWGSYVWLTLYNQLKDAINKRWEAHFVTQREPNSGPPKYSLMGFTWAFKTWILETYRVGALNFYTREERHPRALAWRFKRASNDARASPREVLFSI